MGRHASWGWVCQSGRVRSGVWRLIPPETLVLALAACRNLSRLRPCVQMAPRMEQTGSPSGDLGPCHMESLSCSKDEPCHKLKICGSLRQADPWGKEHGPLGAWVTAHPWGRHSISMTCHACARANVMMDRPQLLGRLWESRESSLPLTLESKKQSSSFHTAAVT